MNGKPEGKRPLGRPICRWEDNIKMDLGQFFMKPSDYYDAPISKVLNFIRSVGLMKG
jgi:hypothetical protein